VALINSDRTLLIPPSLPISALPDTVIIAWKSTPEAARAVTAAMPFLSIVKQIVITTVAEHEPAIQEEGPARLLSNLRWDGYSASVYRLQPGAQGAAETLARGSARSSCLVGDGRLRP